MWTNDFSEWEFRYTAIVTSYDVAYGVRYSTVTASDNSNRQKLVDI